MAKLRSLTFKEKSKTINKKIYNVWDENLHQKIKHYIDSSNFKDDSIQDVEDIMIKKGLQWKRITEICMGPTLIKEKL